MTEDTVLRLTVPSSPPAHLAPVLLDMHTRLAEAETLDNQLDALAEIITSALDAERATLFLIDRRTAEVFARLAVGAERREIRMLASDGVAGHVLATGQGLVVPDAYADPRFNPRIDELTGYRTRSLACVPMRTLRGTVVGVAQALNKRRGDFGPADVEVLGTLTAQAARVLSSSLLLAAIEEASAQESHFVRLVSEMSSEIQLGPLLQKIMAAVTHMLDADRSTLFLNDEKTGELFTVIGQGLGAERLRFPNDQGVAGAAFTSGESIHIPYAYADLRFNPEWDRQTGYFTRSILAVPVVNKAGQVIGVAQALNKRGGGFSEEDGARLRAFTSQIAIALENARLFDEVQAMHQYNDGILASMSSGVVTFDAEGLAVTCNTAAGRILCREPGEVLGQSAAALFPAGNEWVMEKLARAVETGAPETAMDAPVQVSGATIAVNLTAMPLVGAQGAPLGSMILLDDISREKRLKSTMARYVDAAVADKLLEDDAAILGGQSGVATVLFSDIRQFTPLAERLGPAATVALLNDYFTRMVGCIEAEGGMLDKFIGDEIMAIFGVPYPHEDDADRAVRTAVAMLRALDQLNAERAAVGEAPLEIGVGINTGHVFSGNIGSPRRMDFTVMGDGVNLSSRLQGATKQYKAPALLSDFTLRALKGTYRTREIDRVRVVGKEEPVAIHELLEHHDERSFPGLLDTLAAFRDGLALYRGRRFGDAATAFERALAGNPADGVAALYQARCRQFMTAPPANDWDGVWVLTEK